MDSSNDGIKHLKIYNTYNWNWVAGAGRTIPTKNKFSLQIDSFTLFPKFLSCAFRPYVRHHFLVDARSEPRVEDELLAAGHGVVVDVVNAAVAFVGGDLEKQFKNSQLIVLQMTFEVNSS